MSRLRLYLEDDRTVSVLLGHVMDRIVDDYSGFREMVWSMYSGDLREKLLGIGEMRENLKRICQEKIEGSSSA